LDEEPLLGEVVEEPTGLPHAYKEVFEGALLLKSSNGVIVIFTEEVQSLAKLLLEILLSVKHK
jgi:hypothetical protein